MQKINTSPISGMQELTPTFQAEFDRLKVGIQDAFFRHGFQHIETPIIDRTEILLAKAGGDTEKQIYKVIKTTEDIGSSDQALRFDHTVPLARYTVEHLNDLSFPFKVTQIARNFRGERPQKGRFREFYQCDVDVIGRDVLSIDYDAEVIATLVDAIRVLPLPDFVVRVSNRKLLTGLLEELNLEHQSGEIFGIVDHAEKVPPEATSEALRSLGLGEENILKITAFTQIHGNRTEVIPKLRNFGFTNENFNTGIDELERVLQSLELLSPDAHIVADMLIVRGLDYYTGTVFETIVPDHRDIGSICSGGRYEDLAGHYTDHKLPGVGGSIGLTRLFFVLREGGFIRLDDVKSVDICLIPFSERELASTSELAQKLRREGKSVDIVLTDRRLGDKLKYASRVAKFAAVIGEDETKTRTYRLKNLADGTETDNTW